MSRHVYISTSLALFFISFVQGADFDSIFSIHTERTPYCPPNYNPDSKYIGCCWGDYQTITSAKGPDGKSSPGCCYPEDTCTGAPPIMYDWTTDDQGRLDVITPGVTTTADPAATTSWVGTQNENAQPSSQGFDSMLTVTGSTTATSSSSNSGGGGGGSSGSGGLSTGAIAGIVVSAVFSLLTFLFGIWFKFYKLKRRERREDNKLQQQDHQPDQKWSNTLGSDGIRNTFNSTTPPQWNPRQMHY